MLERDGEDGEDTEGRDHDDDHPEERAEERAAGKGRSGFVAGRAGRRARGDRPPRERLLERQRWVAETYLLLGSVKAVERAARERWGISKRTVGRYIEAARDAWAREVPDDRERLRAEHRQRIYKLLGVAVAEKRLHVAATLMKLLLDLDGFSPTQRVELVQRRSPLEGLSDEELDRVIASGGAEVPALPEGRKSN